MNQQQMQFFEQEPPDANERFENSDPREQQYVPLEGAYTGQKLRPQPQIQQKRKHNYLWLWILAPILLFFMIGMSVSWMAIHRADSMPMPGMMQGNPIPDFHQSFAKPIPINGTPTVIINDSTGDVLITVGNVGEVVVGNPSFIGNSYASMHIGQNGNTITIDTSADRAANLSVVVPSNANVVVHDQSGSVAIKGVSGQMQVTTVDGSINIGDGTLSGTSTLQTDTGSVNFQGSLDPQGTYDFESSTGDVNLALPADATFHLNASAGAGVNNAFSSSASSANGPELTAKSNSGVVNLAKQ